MTGQLLKLDSVSYRAGRTTIISDVSLEFPPGKVSALIGPSGSGKSTVLKCLTTLLRPTRGAVYADGRDVWPMRREFRVRLGYVPQDDVLHPQLTVRDAFYYAARLRLDESMGDADLLRRADAVAELLGLSERRGLRVRRLSGGQRKRVNIGVELLADPDILVLDEPASGLDPGTEGDLVKLLRRLAAAGRTVVLTTHSMEYLDEVDGVALLVQGRVEYAGPLAAMLAHYKASHPAEVFRIVRGR